MAKPELCVIYKALYPGQTPLIFHDYYECGAVGLKMTLSSNLSEVEMREISSFLHKNVKETSSLGLQWVGKIDRAQSKSYKSWGTFEKYVNECVKKKILDIIDNLIRESKSHVVSIILLTNCHLYIILYVPKN